MRASIGRRLRCPGSNAFTESFTKNALSPFSTSSGGGGGSGRGRGGPTPFEFTAPGAGSGVSVPGDSSPDDSADRSGPPLGRGRGKPLPSSSTILPSINTFVSSVGRGRGGPTPFEFTAPGAGRGGSVPGDSSADDSADRSGPPLGRGRGKPLPSSSTILPSINTFVSSVGRGRDTTTPPPDHDGSKKPIFFKNEVTEMAGVSQPAAETEEGRRSLPSSILSVLSGAGRGKPVAKPCPDVAPAKEENRHMTSRPLPPPEERGIGRTRREPRFQTQDGPSPGGRGDRGGGRGGGYQAQGRGRGRGRGRGGPGRGRGFRDRGDRRREEDADDEPGAGLYLGEGDDDEKMAERLGPDTMDQLTEAFDEIGERVLPSPAMDMYLDTFHTNCMIEFEPEYHMADFQSNPDIDEKPPISLRDALEKMKPFLMLYEGIKDQKEWEEVMKETMERAPLIKEIVDYYSGPDRVTAKKQQQELERVAKTLPKGVPASVEAFTNRAVLSLQSNPGWGFDKKCQFMDKLVWEVSNQYK